MNFNISDVSTTKMTSKGQVVIPEEIRNHMHLESGVKFLVMATDDSIIFKKIHPIPKQDFKALLAESHRIAKEYGITEDDLKQDIAEVRRERRSKQAKAASLSKSIGKETKKNLSTRSKRKDKSND